ncbi:MAG: hypothetical protein WCW65_03485 [Candidatus Paceibacterota bacterium]
MQKISILNLLKKASNRKFMFGIIGAFVLVSILILIQVSNVKAANTLSVIVSSKDSSVGYDESTIIYFSASGADNITCDAGDGSREDEFETGNLTETTTFTVSCSGFDNSTPPPPPPSCTGTFTIPGFCGPRDQEINCNNLRLGEGAYNCESMGCIGYNYRWAGDTGYCTNQQYMMCSDMQSEDTCNVVGCSWTPSDSGSCSSIFDSLTCTFTSGCTWQ